MARDNLLVGIDIGSSKIAVCVGAPSEEGELQILGLAAVPHTGLRKGVVTDLEETVSAISHALEEAERMAGQNLTHATVAINGSHIESRVAKGIIAISKPNGAIDQNDVDRVIDAARSATLPQNRELVHLFPQRYVVDGQEEVRDPVGMNGIRLEIEAILISSSAAATRNIIRSVNQSGLEIDGLVFGPLAAAKFITNRKQRESGVLLIDMGAGSTNIAIFEEGQLLHAAAIPIGSTHITHDLAIGLRTNLDVAETIKLKYGSALPDKIRESEMINLASIDPGEGDKVSKRQVAEIIEARAAEIFHLVKEQLQGIGRDGLLPAGVIFTGGGSELEGLTELAKQTLRLPTTIGFPTVQLQGVVDKIDNPIYATSVGLVLWSLEASQADGHAPLRLSLDKFGGVFDKFKGILKNFTN